MKVQAVSAKSYFLTGAAGRGAGAGAAGVAGTGIPVRGAAVAGVVTGRVPSDVCTCILSDRARVDRLALCRDHLEVRSSPTISTSMNVSPRPIPSRSDSTSEIAAAQLRGAARDEIRDALLRLDALVEVLVAGEDDVDAVLDEQRLELVAQQRRPIRASRPTNRADGGRRRSSSPSRSPPAPSRATASCLSSM